MNILNEENVKRAKIKQYRTKTPAPFGDRGFGLPEAAGSPVSHNSQGGGRCEYAFVQNFS